MVESVFVEITSCNDCPNTSPCNIGGYFCDLMGDEEAVENRMFWYNKEIPDNCPLLKESVNNGG